MSSVRRSSETFNDGQIALLERVARGAPLSETLNGIVLLIEGRAAGMLCSILLVDKPAQAVRHGAAPTLPHAYVRALDGSRIGPSAGSCGTAAYRGERVIVEDIATSPLWADYKDLALPHGLRACWSSPIFSPEHVVLGTFAMYYLEPRGPSPEERLWVDTATHLAALAILRDRAEAALRRSEGRLRAVIEHTPHVSIQWYDANGRILFCNLASERVFGVSRAQALGKRLDELNFPALESERFIETLRRVAATGHPVGPMEFRFVQPDGRDGVLLSTVFQIPTEDTESCFVCMDVDLSESKRLEEIAHANERLRAFIYNSVADIIFCLTVEGEGQYRFLSVNPAFLKATGLSEEQVVGARVETVIPASSLPMVLDQYDRAIRNRCTVSWDEVSTYPSGVRYGEVTVAPMFESNGRCTKLIGTVHDITARKQAEEERRRFELQLRRAQRLQALGGLAGGIAHDFNNIITAIATYVDLAMGDVPDGHPTTESLVEIRKASHRAAALVRQIWTFSHPTEPKREMIDLRVVIEEALDLLRVTLPASIQVRTTFAHDTPKVCADASQLHQLVMNLGTNAAHALGEGGGIIEVVSDRIDHHVDDDASPPNSNVGAYARVRVIDDGCGMDPTTLERAFDPFFTTKPTGKGTGLGLSVVHGIMQAHQGTVRLESAVGRGTTAILLFPDLQGATHTHESSMASSP